MKCECGCEYALIGELIGGNKIYYCITCGRLTVDYINKTFSSGELYTPESVTVVKDLYECFYRNKIEQKKQDDYSDGYNEARQELE